MTLSSSGVARLASERMRSAISAPHGAVGHFEKVLPHQVPVQVKGPELGGLEHGPDAGDVVLAVLDAEGF